MNTTIAVLELKRSDKLNVLASAAVQISLDDETKKNDHRFQGSAKQAGQFLGCGTIPRSPASRWQGL